MGLIVLGLGLAVDLGVRVELQRLVPVGGRLRNVSWTGNETWNAVAWDVN